VAHGTPEAISAAPESITGLYLKPLLTRASAARISGAVVA
jgi:hypothetical protein